MAQKLAANFAGKDFSQERWDRIAEHALNIPTLLLDLEILWERLEPAKLPG